MVCRTTFIFLVFSQPRTHDHEFQVCKSRIPLARVEIEFRNLSIYTPCFESGGQVPVWSEEMVGGLQEESERGKALFNEVAVIRADRPVQGACRGNEWTC